MGPYAGRFKYILITMLTTACVITGCAAKVPEADLDISERLDQYVNALNEACTGQQINGSILIASKGSIVANKSYGMADYENGTSFTRDTVSRLASATKLFTAVAVMQLYENGLLDLDDKVSKYLPRQVDGDKITIHQLLTHTSGIIRDVTDYGDLNPYQYTSKTKLIDLVNRRQLICEPGGGMNYSNAGYQLLACIVEKVSGKTYEEYVKENIFLPAGMSSTGCDGFGREIPNLASGYEFRGGRFDKKKQFDMSHAFGSGHIYSTVHDMYLFDRALREGRLVSEETLNKMACDNTGIGMGYGYGCFVGELKGHKWFGHPGNLSSGYFSYYVCFPEDDLVVIMLFNTIWLDNNNIMKAVCAIALGEEYRLATVKKEAVIDKKTLSGFEGEYETPEGKIIRVKSLAAGLVVMSDGTNLLLVPCSENTFFQRGYEHYDHIFESDAKGEIKYYILRNSVDEIRMKKL